MLYIKEGYAICHHVIGKHTGKQENVAYKSDGKNCDCKWISPLFMPKDAARTWRKVKSVRAERIQDISEPDAIAEGVGCNCLVAEWDGEKYYVPKGKKCNDHLDCEFCSLDEWINYLNGEDGEPAYTATESFQSLWDSINAKPKPIYRKIDGKKQIVSYVSYPWEAPGKIETEHRGKPLTVYPNPWVYPYEFEVTHDR